MTHAEEAQRLFMGVLDMKGAVALEGQMFRQLVELAESNGQSPQDSVEEIVRFAVPALDWKNLPRADIVFRWVMNAAPELGISELRIAEFLTRLLMYGVYESCRPSVVLPPLEESSLMAQAFFLGRMDPNYRSDMRMRAEEGYARINGRASSEEQIQLAIERSLGKIFTLEQALLIMQPFRVRLFQNDVPEDLTYRVFLRSLTAIAYKMATGAL